MLLICTVAVSGGVLNVRRHFAVPAATPIIFNAVVIVVALVAAMSFGWRDITLLHAVCAAVMIAGVLQLAAIGVALRQIRFFPIFGGPWRDPRIKKVMLMMAPMVVGLSAVQINTLADYAIAYFFVSTDHGHVGPAVLRYAHYLYQLPLGVFGIAIATAIYPVLARHAARNDHAGLADDLVRGARLCVFIALPATVGLCVVARPLVASLFEHGEFDAWATNRVAGTLVFYSLGLCAYFVQHLIVRTFYATHDSKTPARIAVRMVAVNLLMNLVLVFVMEERGLALATATCAFFQVLWLARSLSRTSLSVAWLRIGAGFAKSAICTAIMSAGLAGTHSLIPVVFRDEPGSALRLTVLVLVGIAVYVAAAAILRVEEFGMLFRRAASDRASGGEGG